MASDIFISYAYQDVEFVTQLHQNLTDRNFSAWFDPEVEKVADQWRTSVVEGIRDCKVFLLVLSPDSAASNNVRKEVDLAERYKRRIVPLIWRNTEIPVAMEYQLAGIQWVEFRETPSSENFNKLVDILRRLLSSDSVSEATSSKQVAIKESTPIVPKPEPVPTFTGQKLDRSKRGPQVSAFAVGVGVITKVVLSITAFTRDERDEIIDELVWLFNAADHFLKIQQGIVDSTKPVPVVIPPQAETSAEANNKVLTRVDDFWLQMIEEQVENIITRVDIYLARLVFELDREAMFGGAEVAGTALLNSIAFQREAIVGCIQELAELMQYLYGVIVYAPDDLAKYQEGWFKNRLTLF